MTSRASKLLLGKARKPKGSEPKDIAAEETRIQQALIAAITARRSDKRFMQRVADIVEGSKRGKHGPQPARWENAALVATVELCFKHYGAVPKKTAYIEAGRVLNKSWTTVRDRYCKLIKDPTLQTCRLS